MKIDTTCPLYVVRRRYCDETDDYDLHVERCGEQLGIQWTSWGELDADGLAVEEMTIWRAECIRGHVLAVPDDEGGDPGAVPLSLDAVGAIVGKYAAQAQAVDRIGLALSVLDGSGAELALVDLVRDVLTGQTPADPEVRTDG